MNDLWSIRKQLLVRSGRSLRMDSRAKENEPSECGWSGTKPVNLFSMVVERDRPVFLSKFFDCPVSSMSHWKWPFIIRRMENSAQPSRTINIWFNQERDSKWNFLCTDRISICNSFYFDIIQLWNSYHVPIITNSNHFLVVCCCLQHLLLLTTQLAYKNWTIFVWKIFWTQIAHYIGY